MHREKKRTDAHKVQFASLQWLIFPPKHKVLMRFNVVGTFLLHYIQSEDIYVLFHENYQTNSSLIHLLEPLVFLHLSQRSYAAEYWSLLCNNDYCAATFSALYEIQFLASFRTKREQHSP